MIARSVHFLIGGTAAVMISACGVNRATLSSADLTEFEARIAAESKAERVAGAEKVIRRMRAEQLDYDARIAAGERTEPPVFDVLVLSGGGDYGAFGAGVLAGWGDVRGELARPTFDLVTGVSTGALIAPFAYMGTSASYEQILELYSQPKDDWVAIKGLLFFWPWRESFASADGLRRDVEAAMPMEFVRELAVESRKGRALWIGTTNLDLGITRGFNLGTEAERADELGDAKRFHDILMASAAIPAAFPPVVIDGSLYVDGGTTANIFFGTDLTAPRGVIARWSEANPGVKPSRLRFWVIVNNRLGQAPTLVQPTWPSITLNSLETAIRFSTIASLRNLAAQTELVRLRNGLETEFRYISIPEDWTPPVDGTFQKETMQSLATLGRRLGADGANWRTSLPEE
jgi:predicted acylesterase/phospholipase RssA